MLNLSNWTIEFKQSAYYARLILVIYVSTFTVLIYSSVIFQLKILVFILLAIHLVRIINNPNPYPNYLALTYKDDAWLLATSKKLLIYEKGRVLIDTGLFFILELRSANRRKLIVIFVDQLNINNYRSLKIIEKINK